MNKARDRDLVRLYWPAALRPAFDALFDIDDAMGDVVVRATEPTLAAIKLAWWREQLARLDTEAPPVEPRLQAAAAELLSRGITGADLARLEESWALLLRTDDQPTFMRGVTSRGPLLFTLAARVLGIAMDDHLANAAQSFAAADLARRGIIDLAPLKLRRSKVRAPRRSRPLTALEVLARRDMRRGGPPFEPEATPGRSWALIRHRMTGRI
jgi:phytoene synthase